MSKRKVPRKFFPYMPTSSDARNFFMDLSATTTFQSWPVVYISHCNSFYQDKMPKHKNSSTGVPEDKLNFI